MENWQACSIFVLGNSLGQAQPNEISFLNNLNYGLWVQWVYYII
jgi:hypothetical protein